MFPIVEIYNTRDGSKTLQNIELQETYHSRNGAVAETAHVFIEAGLKFALSQKNTLTLLEVGLGTGLNALMTLQFLKNLENAPYTVHYIALEPYPLTYEQIKKLEYSKTLQDPDLEVFMAHIHEAKEKEIINLLPNMTFEKHFCKVENVLLAQLVDLVYFDAFGPRAQPELWEVPALEKVAALMLKGGILTTYCAKGQFKRNLRQTGFEVKKLPGPPGKEQMTRAIRL
jgi:tRNA U34 5-methylaminomethyl-2-thiouridine-forming methyltransferase MnmC